MIFVLLIFFFFSVSFGHLNIVLLGKQKSYSLFGMNIWGKKLSESGAR